MHSVIFHTHKISVLVFLLIYLIKTFLLLGNNTEKLARFVKATKVPEMIVSFLFLLTGLYLIIQLPEVNTFMIIKLIAVFASIPLAIIGFKKSNKLLAGLAMFLIIMAYGFAEMSKKKSAGASEKITTTNGKEVYNTYCAKCHGEDGTLGAMGAANLKASTLNNESLLEVIKKGKGAMLGYESQLTEEQIKEVANYTEALRNK